MYTYIYKYAYAFTYACLVCTKCCSVLQCVAVYCSVLQCVAVYCSVLQCIYVCMSCMCIYTYMSRAVLSFVTPIFRCDITLQHTATHYNTILQ